jgi:exodeoxyribonuclease VII large subunit
MHQEPLTVSQLNRQIRHYLESELGEVAVTGELSNVKYHASGHIYCSLKDATAQVRCAFFRNYHSNNMPILKDGDEVTITGLLTLYEGRGDYQIVIYSLHTKGLGDLYQAFELLKQKCTIAGYFNPEHKKPIPKFPKKIGIITSATGAALHDCLTTLARRYPLAEVLVHPVEVQGKNAPLQIITALQHANHTKICDVLLIVRGGGSMEDLFVFNDEDLVKAIFESNIPIISGVGHETDVTLTDFVADLRAATPTAAAENATPDFQHLYNYIHDLNNRLANGCKKLVLHARLNINNVENNLNQLIQYNFSVLKESFIKLIAQLEALSPLATLLRGYAIVSQDKIILSNINQLNDTMPIDIRISNGILSCNVIKKTKL